MTKQLTFPFPLTFFFKQPFKSKRNLNRHLGLGNSGEIYYGRSEVTYLQFFSNNIEIIFPQLNQKE